MRTFLTTIGLLALISAAAQADTRITLDQTAMTGNPGDVLQFSGVITNLDPTNTVYLNDFSIDLSSGDFRGDGMDEFFNDVPLYLAGGANSGDIPLFKVTINGPNLDPTGTYGGTYTLFGGVDGNASDNIGQVNFSVTDTPEPGDFGLMMLGCGVLGLGYLTKCIPRKRPLIPSLGSSSSS